MDRRKAIQAFGLAAVPVLLASGTSIAQADSLTVTQWRSDTLQYGSFSLRISRELLKRSTNATVREFAHLEIIEQTTAAMVLTQKRNPPPVMLTPRQDADLKALAASATVDLTYVGLEIKGHEELLKIQDAFLHGQPDLANKTSDEAYLLKSNVEQHLRLLKTVILAAANSGG